MAEQYIVVFMHNDITHTHHYVPKKEDQIFLDLEITL